MNGNVKTDFLTSTSTFFTGAGSVMNLAGNYYDFNTSEDADGQALAADWKVVGQDMEKALQDRCGAPLERKSAK